MAFSASVPSILYCLAERLLFALTIKAKFAQGISVIVLILPNVRGRVLIKDFTLSKI